MNQHLNYDNSQENPQTICFVWTIMDMPHHFRSFFMGNQIQREPDLIIFETSRFVGSITGFIVTRKLHPFFLGGHGYMKANTGILKVLNRIPGIPARIIQPIRETVSNHFGCQLCLIAQQNHSFTLRFVRRRSYPPGRQNPRYPTAHRGYRGGGRRIR